MIIQGNLVQHRTIMVTIEPSIREFAFAEVEFQSSAPPRNPQIPTYQLQNQNPAYGTFAAEFNCRSLRTFSPQIEEVRIVRLKILGGFATGTEAPSALIAKGYSQNDRAQCEDRTYRT